MEEETKEEAYTRAIAIIRSCRTREQLANARNYVRRFTAAYGQCDGTKILTDTLSATDRRLFPRDKENG